MTQKLFGIIGWKNSGKTTMTERLVRNLTGRGYRIATVKHAHHDFDIDQEGKDSWRHRKAGAAEVAVVSAKRYAIIHENGNEPEPPLTDILARLSPCDLVLIEGYKRDSHKKIELRRNESAKTERLSPTDANIVAIASDQPQTDESLPVFHLDDIDAIADFIVQELELHKTT